MKLFFGNFSGFDGFIQGQKSPKSFVSAPNHDFSPILASLFFKMNAFVSGAVFSWFGVPCALASVNRPKISGGIVFGVPVNMVNNFRKVPMLHSKNNAVGVLKNAKKFYFVVNSARLIGAFARCLAAMFAKKQVALIVAYKNLLQKFDGNFLAHKLPQVIDGVIIAKDVKHG
jgi:hypothetical protein